MRKNVKGFTLVELVVVIAVFSLIMFGALQLMDPVSKIMNKSVKTEGISSATTNIGNYLDGELRYAECLQVYVNQTPTDNDIFNFIDSCYNGMVYQADSTGTMNYAGGTVHVLRIDNQNGGRINKWELGYQAGDSVIGVDTTVEALTGSGTPMINEAFFDDYSFVVSLGIVNYDQPTLSIVRDDAYYGNYSYPNYQVVGQQNFGVSITAFENSAVQDYNDAVAAGETPENYSGYVFNKSLALSNMNSDTARNADIRYYKHNWDTSVTPPVEATTEIEGEVRTLYNTGDFTTVHRFEIRDGGDTSTYLEPDFLYIVYTYGGVDIIQPTT